MAQYFEEPVARLLRRLKVTPNAVTAIGLLVTAAAAYLASQDLLFYAGIVLLLASVMDLLDGALARLTNRAGPFGAVLDSVADRLGEAVLLLGLVVFYLDRDDKDAVLLVFAVLVSSFIVSYLRARGEGVGIAMKESGLVTRVERVLIMVLGLLTGWVVAALVVLLGASAVTASQRLRHIWRQTRDV